MEKNLDRAFIYTSLVLYGTLILIVMYESGISQIDNAGENVPDKLVFIIMMLSIVWITMIFPVCFFTHVGTFVIELLKQNKSIKDYVLFLLSFISLAFWGYITTPIIHGIIWIIRQFFSP